MDKIKQRVQSRIANISTIDTLSSNRHISAVEVGTRIAMLQCHKNVGGIGLNANVTTFAVCCCVSRQCPNDIFAL